MWKRTGDISIAVERICKFHTNMTGEKSISQTTIVGKDVNEVSSRGVRPRARARRVARDVGLDRHLQPLTTDYQVRGIPTFTKDSEAEAIWRAGTFTA